MRVSLGKTTGQASKDSSFNQRLDLPKETAGWWISCHTTSHPLREKPYPMTRLLSVPLVTHWSTSCTIVSACFFILPQNQTYPVFRDPEEEDMKLQTNEGKNAKKNELM